MTLRDMVGAVRARLVDDARHLHRFFSVRAAALGMALLTAWPQIPDDVKALLPGWVTRVIAYAILAAVIMGAAAKQNFGGNPPSDGGQP